MPMDYSEFKKLLAGYKEVQKKHETFIRNFLTTMGMRAIAQTKALTPVDTSNLINRWELSQVYRSGDSLYIVLFNPVVYASFVEDGHMQHKRWVPGKWSGKKFTYIPNAKTGMMLKNKFIPGHHMARVSIAKVELELPARYDKAFKQFLAGLGVS